MKRSTGPLMDSVSAATSCHVRPRISVSAPRLRLRSLRKYSRRAGGFMAPDDKRRRPSEATGRRLLANRRRGNAGGGNAAGTVAAPERVSAEQVRSRQGRLAELRGTVEAYLNAPGQLKR